MSKKEKGLDYSDYYLKNQRPGTNVKYENVSYSSYRSNSEKEEIPRIRALIPDEIDNEPYYQHHTVEYIPKGSRDVKPPKKKKSKKERKTRNKNIILVSLTILLCFAITILVADAMSGGYVLDELQSTFLGRNMESGVYYALEMGAFVDSTTAKVYSTELRNMGCGGYVINDGMYRVIGEVYPTRKQAEEVSARLNMEGNITQIYELKTADIDYKLFPQSVRNTTKRTMEYADEIYKRLFEVGVKLAKGQFDKNSATAEINTIKLNVNTTLVEYESNVDNKLDDKYVTKVRMQLAAVSAMLDNITSSTNKSPGLLSDIRYANAMILNTHRALTLDLQSSSNSK